ncbi:hypothetical protein Nepgr_002255 [Nepenthes gracilis]|uniref:Protein kinase domain-containing protein n=1 Tax=Nepenthes gracilis TaxID=150966 RepID=A0AAD3P5X7_NEPGR|nr:hypothetical protein Nepgr_002255 [Nepenthes gracilis]
MFHQSLNNSKKLNVVEAYIAPIVESDEGACEAKEQALIKINEDFAESVLKQECAVCSPCSNSSDESSDLDHESGAIVPVSNETLSHHTPPFTNSRCLPIELEGLHGNYLSTCRVSKYQELQLATSNFSPGNLMEKGGSSRVYRGCLSDRNELAVKKLKHSEEMLKEFILEIGIITSLHHKNMMSLFGFCFEGDNLLLVYDFLPRGSLEENLHGCKKDPRAVGWNERYKQLAGTNAVVYYSTSVFHSAEIAYDVATSALVGATNVVGTAIASSLTYKQGRKSLLSTRFSGMTASMLLLSLSFTRKIGLLHKERQSAGKSTGASHHQHAMSYDTLGRVSSSYMTEDTSVDAISEKELGNEYFKQKKFNEAIISFPGKHRFLPPSVAYANKAMAYPKIKRFQEAEDKLYRGFKPR